jgi:hypothetical protein
VVCGGVWWCVYERERCVGCGGVWVSVRECGKDRKDPPRTSRGACALFPSFPFLFFIAWLCAGVCACGGV